MVAIWVRIWGSAAREKTAKNDDLCNSKEKCKKKKTKKKKRFAGELVVFVRVFFLLFVM